MRDLWALLRQPCSPPNCSALLVADSNQVMALTAELDLDLVLQGVQYHPVAVARWRHSVHLGRSRLVQALHWSSRHLPRGLSGRPRWGLSRQRQRAATGQQPHRIAEGMCNGS